MICPEWFALLKMRMGEEFDDYGKKLPPSGCPMPLIFDGITLGTLYLKGSPWELRENVGFKKLFSMKHDMEYMSIFMRYLLTYKNLLFHNNNKIEITNL